jgi:hypothetical protein
MKATVKNNAYPKHFAESRFNGRKGKVAHVSSTEPEICIKFKDGNQLGLG